MVTFKPFEKCGSSESLYVPIAGCIKGKNTFGIEGDLIDDVELVAGDHGATCLSVARKVYKQIALNVAHCCFFPFEGSDL